ncbi:MAG: aminotransferase DegT [Sulfurimonas sp. RIFCSPHIGHO2_12_FULL_36_9]|uniref:DegT/DnrJ/EryC1/StrS family aminotransferase n=1 Tax=unclassified Sulfurimonas TaxID=2623549 RepID=UPI0008B3A4A4|nr:MULTISPECIES: DegT/DnrJ/EryC1/StrS family aminotransferase [unclassified Sulfurimonas]OHD96569.1 MAG: aminotransferase DegT [Sulfurimonas sp. RIFCSPHIGHO2_12_FULL_36_9]OHD99703.1 MAG: aminotransferase DegT [Sulfurimonas sp. RIFCSPLOWO2_02_FULL_36_28]OHE02265.1 MAG: aminotransferase DegT [Sulfurimonas sp. RIFCSPLOWO2_12_36_12]OHE05540.1 MAG: aminotransferase DegT [Sulfurimonas sp. RIFCSPLOWO2_12_FULL_36_74]
MKVPFCKYESSREAHSNVSDVLDGENIDQVEELENEFISYIGADYALATSHGTSALHLAMLALDLKRGDKVVCSVNAHPNVPEVVRHFDAEPVFIDIDAESYNINLDKLETYLEDNKAKKLKAVIVTHVAGQCVDLNRLYTMAKIYDVKIVEDASEALGATYKGEKIGSTGADITCFNFSSHLKKDVCNGGMLVSNSKEIIERAKLLSSHAMRRDEDSLDYVYDVVDIGFDYSMSQLDAAYIRAKIKEQDKNLKRVQEIAQMYNKALSGVNHIAIPKQSADEHPYSLYIVKVDKNRDSFALELKKQGIEVGLHYIPLHFLSYYKNKYALKVNNFPVALTSYQRVMSLPIHASMQDKEVQFVIDKIKSVASTRV